MWRNICQGVAPSRVAASYSDGGTVCRPARRVIAMNGTPRQMLAKITLACAWSGTPRKSMLPEMSPIFLKVHETIENCGSKIHQKAIAESTVGTMNGIRITARTIARNGMYLLRRRARYSPMTNLNALATTVYVIV